MTTLREALSTGEVGTVHRAALQHRACWPHEARLAARALSAGVSPPGQPPPGETVWPWASPHGPHAALWTLSWTAPTVGGTPYRSAVRQTPTELLTLVLQSIPLLYARPPGAWPAPQRQVLGALGDAHAVAPDGDRVDLALALALASRIWETSLPATVVACATVDPDGTLHPVEGLDATLRVLMAWALGVTTVLVARSQADAARAVVKAHGGAVTVVPAGTLRDALAWVAARMLPGGLRPAWRDAHGVTTAAQEAVEALFTLALSGDALPTWQPVVHAAWMLQRLFPEGSRERARVAVAEGLARRHGNPDAAVAWLPAETDPPGAPSDEAWSRVGHTVVAVAEANVEESVAIRDDAVRRVGIHRLRVHLRVLGAVQRAAEITRDHVRAATLGRELFHRWMAAFDGEEAWGPLCGWLRADALLGGVHGAAVEKAATDWLTRLGPGDAAAAVQVHLALGRARVLRRRPLRDIIAALGPGVAAWDQTPVAVQVARGRWWIRALWSDGQHPEAVRVRTDLAAMAAHGLELLALDQRLLEGADEDAVTAAVARFSGERPQGIRWLLDPALSPRAQAQRIADETVD